MKDQTNTVIAGGVGTLIGVLLALGAVSPEIIYVEEPENQPPMPGSAVVNVMSVYDMTINFTLMIEREIVEQVNLSEGDTESFDYKHVPADGWYVEAYYTTWEGTRYYPIDDGFLGKNDTLQITILNDGSVHHSWGKLNAT